MRVYVGATFTRYEEARAIVDALTGAGHTITHDWTRTDAFGPDGHPLPETAGGYGLPSDVMAMHADDDLRAIWDADRLLILGQQASCGWPIEVGAALMLGHLRDMGTVIRSPEVWIVAPFRPTVFWALPQIRVFSDVAEPLSLMGAALDVAA